MRSLIAWLTQQVAEATRPITAHLPRGMTIVIPETRVRLEVDPPTSHTPSPVAHHYSAGGYTPRRHTITDHTTHSTNTHDGTTT